MKFYQFALFVCSVFLTLYDCEAQLNKIDSNYQSTISTRGNRDMPAIQDIVPLAFQQIGEEEGLPKYVTCTKKDQQGFVWIGTASGLFRYDGIEFKHFKHIVGDTTSLVNSYIINIYIDQSNTLWVITDTDVLHRYDARLEHFQRINLILATKDSLPVRASEIIQDKYNGFWLNTHGHGFNRLDVNTGELTPLSVPELETTTPFWYSLADRDGNIWTTAGTHLFCVFLNKVSREVDSVKAYLDIEMTIEALLEDTDGTIWIGGSNSHQLCYIPSRTTTLLRYNLDAYSSEEYDATIAALGQASNGNIWVGATRWLGIINLTTSQQTFFRQADGLPTGMNNQSVSDIYMEKKGGVVLGMFGGGLAYYDNNLARFGHFQHLSNKNNSLSNNSIKGFYEAEVGAIWVATVDGLNKFNRQTGGMQRFVPKLPLSSYLYSMATKEETLRDPTNNLWVGSIEGLLLLDTNLGKFSKWKSPSKKNKYLESASIPYLQKDKNGVLWIVNYGFDDNHSNISFFDKRKADFRVFDVVYRNKQIKVKKDHILLDSGNPYHFWLLSEQNQLFLLDINTKQLMRIPIAGLLNEQIQWFNCILKDRKDRLWIGTDYGLYLLSPSIDRTETYTTKQFTEKDGLPSNLIYGLLEADNGDIWIGTSNGLSKLATTTMTFRNYSKPDGLQANTSYSMSTYKSPTTGELYFGGTNGFNVFNPDSIIHNPIPPALAITRIEVFRNSRMQQLFPDLPSDLHQNPQIELFDGDKLLQIKYVSPNISHPQLIQYAIQLAGYDQDWRLVDNQHEAVYTNLNPGNYTFRVKAANKDGVWNEVGTALDIVVYPPWWATWWAYMIYVLFSIGGLYILYHFQLNWNLEKMEALRLKEMDTLKSRFFANISHELRTPLTLILGPINAALKRNKLASPDANYLKIARKNGQQLLQLVNSILDLSKLDVNKLILQETVIDFYPLIHRLVGVFQSSADIQHIQLIYSDPLAVPLKIQLDVPKFEVIINNLLSNALKFTPKGGKIEVQVLVHEKQIEIKVTDTGKGIATEDLPFIFDRYYQSKKNKQVLEGGTGIGLALSKEYAQLFKGDLSASSVLGKSSTFTLVFPKKVATTVAISLEPNLASLIQSNPTEIRPTPITNGQKDKAKLLIVEDNKDLRLYIQSILGDTYQCFTAENGQVAWDWLNDATKVQPDLIISDLMMPFMDGFELLEKIKANDKWRMTPVIMLTARSAKEDRLKALTIGIDDYLTKPFDAEELLARTNNLLQNYLTRKIQFQTQLPTTKDVQPETIQFKSVTAADVEWLEEVTENIKADIGKYDLNLSSIAIKMAISERQLRRRILATTGMKAGAYLKEIRLQQARHFLEHKAYLSIAEVSYAVGFNTPKYFTKIYKTRFGKLPSAYF